MEPVGFLDIEGQVVGTEVGLLEVTSYKWWVCPGTSQGHLCSLQFLSKF